MTIGWPVPLRVRIQGAVTLGRGGAVAVGAVTSGVVDSGPYVAMASPPHISVQRWEAAGGVVRIIVAHPTGVAPLVVGPLGLGRGGGGGDRMGRGRRRRRRDRGGHDRGGD